MQKVIILNKKEGETPLEALENFRAKHKEYKEVKMTYAGRLDPMASGVLIILAGEETKNKEKYLNYDKEYEFQILFGFATDTYDILGKVITCVRQDLTQDKVYARQDLVKLIKKNLKYFIGERIQKYPIYSSKTVKGKPLFVYARENEEVEIPERKVFIKQIRFLGLKKITNKKLLENIERRVKKVKGDFRQKEILKIWQQQIQQGLPSLRIGEFKVKCSSGTYVRGIANSLGEKIDIPALAFSIKRTKVGKFKN